MNPISVVRWAAVLAAVAGSAASPAQAPVFVAVETHALQTAGNSEYRGSRIGRGIERAAPVLMETRGHVDANGAVSTSCAAIPSAVPHSESATHAITKQEQR